MQQEKKICNLRLTVSAAKCVNMYMAGSVSLCVWHRRTRIGGKLTSIMKDRGYNLPYLQLPYFLWYCVRGMVEMTPESQHEHYFPTYFENYHTIIICSERLQPIAVDEMNKCINKSINNGTREMRCGFSRIYIDF